MKRAALFALAAVLLPACGDSSGTFVIVRFKRGSVPGAVHRIDVTLTLDAQPLPKVAQFRESGGGPIPLDDLGTVDGSWRIHNGVGAGMVRAIAYDASDVPVGTGEVAITVERGATKTFELCFGGCQMVDGGVDGGDSGTGGLLISPPEYDFGTLLVGSSSAPVLLTVTNTATTATGRPTVMVSPAGPFMATGCDTPALAPGGICQLLVLFQPTTTGDATAMLSVTASPGGMTQTTLRGKGAMPGALKVTPSARNFGSVAVGGGSAPVTFEVVNEGLVSTSALFTSLTGSDMTQFRVASDSCIGAPLAAGGRCTLSVQFTPGSPGTKAASLVIAGSPGGTAVATLSGVGLAAGNLVMSPATRDFGNVAQGTPGPVEAFTVRNAGQTPVTGLQATLTGSHAGEYMITQDDCSSTQLAPMATCLVRVQFLPMSGGVKVATLSVGGGGGAASAALIGTGISPASIDVTPKQHDFGTITIGSSATLTLMVTNRGGAASGTISHVLTGTDFIYVGDNCTTLAPSASCSATVRLSPTGSAGQRMGMLTMSASPGGQSTAMMTGSAVPAGGLTIAPSSFNFGDVGQGGQSAPTTFTVTNTTGASTGSLSVGISGSGSTSFQITQDGCGGTVLPASGTCQLQVRFQPTAAGAQSASLAVSGSPGGVGTSALSGNGVAPANLEINPQSVDYGTVPLGSTSPPERFTVQNTGGQTATSLSALLTGSNQGEFMITSSSCNSNLAPFAQCTVDVVFRPTSPGGKTASLRVAATSGQVVTAALMGAASSNASLDLDPTSEYFGSIDIGQVSGNFTFNVTNVGGSTTGVLTLSVSGVNSTEFKIINNSCFGMALASAQSCSLQMYFQPTNKGPRMASLDVSASPGGSVSAGLSGDGNDPQQPALLTIAPISFNYGSVSVGSSRPHSFTVTNAGGTTSSQINLGINPMPSMPPFVIDPPTTGFDCQDGVTTLAPSGQCFVSVTYQPPAIGTHTATLSASATQGGTATATLTGNGTNATGGLIGSPLSLGFGIVMVCDFGTPQQWTITNMSSVSTGPLSVVPSGNIDQFPYSHNCPLMLGPGQGCTATFNFHPTTAGMKVATVTVSGTPGGSVMVSLSGYGMQRPTSNDAGVDPGCGATGEDPP